MGILDQCLFIKKQPTALPLIGSEGAFIDTTIKSTRGLIVLEGLRSSGDPKILNTRFLSPYLNYPTSIPGETVMMPGSRLPLSPLRSRPLWLAMVISFSKPEIASSFMPMANFTLTYCLRSLSQATVC